MITKDTMKTHAFDAANGTIAVSYFTAVLNGWTVSEWAAAAALVYSMILIVDKAISMTRRFIAWRRARTSV